MMSIKGIRKTQHVIMLGKAKEGRERVKENGGVNSKLVQRG